MKTQVICRVCGRDFAAPRRDAVTCTDVCRQRLKRGGAFAYLKGLSAKKQRAEREAHAAHDAAVAAWKKAAAAKRRLRARRRAQRQRRLHRREGEPPHIRLIAAMERQHRRIEKLRQAGLAEYRIPKVDPSDRKAITDHGRVRHALVDFAELAALPSEIREQLVDDLVDSARRARCGVKAGKRKRGVSNKKLTQTFFLAGVGRAMKRAGLPAPRWRKRYDRRGGPDISAPESPFFRLARKVARVAGIVLPKDLKVLAWRAARVHGAMTPTMAAAQEAWMAAQRQHRAAAS